MKADVRVLRGASLRERRRVVVGRKDAGNAGNVGVSVDAVDERPRSVYEVVTRQMLVELKADVTEVKGRVNALLWLVAGAIVVELVTKVVR